jgi:preprotein translocase subunit SecA
MARQQALNEGVAEAVIKGEEKYVDDDEYVNFFHVDAFYRVKRADWDRIFTHFKRQCDEEHKEVVNLGGLHIIGTERHEARRIDNQLRGRAGRQGDPGSSRFFLSLEDDLMRIFGSDRISGLMQRLGMEEGVPIEHGMVTRAIERAQKQVEAQNFSVRKHLLEYDDVMNKQRESVYTLRREILEGKIHLSEEEVSDLRGYVVATAEEIFDDRFERAVGKDADEDEWDVPALGRELTQLFALDENDVKGIEEMGNNELRDHLWSKVLAKYEDKEKIVPRDILTRVERDIMLQIVDQQWKDHLYSLDHLKEGIGLRGYGQRDPLPGHARPHRGRDRSLPVVAQAGRRTRRRRGPRGGAGAAGAETAGRAQLQQPAGTTAVRFCSEGRGVRAGGRRRSRPGPPAGARRRRRRDQDRQA